MHALALLLLSVVPQAGGVLADRVDLIELNHFYDEQGREVFDQMIFWEWDGDRSRFHAIDFRLVKSPRQVPAFDFETRCWVSIWPDGDLLRKVRAGSFRETWTQYDPELYDRKFVPKDLRRGLARPAHPHELIVAP